MIYRYVQSEDDIYLLSIISMKIRKSVRKEIDLRNIVWSDVETNHITIIGLPHDRSEKTRETIKQLVDCSLSAATLGS